MIQNLKIVDDVFIDDNDYLTENILKTYKIDKVYQAITGNDNWSYYYHIPIKMNIMEFIDYDITTISRSPIFDMSLFSAKEPTTLTEAHPSNKRIFLSKFIMFFFCL